MARNYCSMEENFHWFIENFEKLKIKCLGKYLIIVNKNIVGVYESLEDAYKNSEKHENSNFIIQYCGKDKSCYTQSFTNLHF